MSVDKLQLSSRFTKIFMDHFLKSGGTRFKAELLFFLYDIQFCSSESLLLSNDKTESRRSVTNVAQSHCGKLLETYPERLTAVSLPKVLLQKVLTQGCEYLCKLTTISVFYS